MPQTINISTKSKESFQKQNRNVTNKTTIIKISTYYDMLYPKVMTNNENTSFKNYDKLMFFILK
jgi:hypothetical protein